MKRYLVPGFLLLLVGFSMAPLRSWCQEGATQQLKAGDQAPKLVSFDISDSIINSDDLLDKKYLLISFMATYCKPCIKEFPELKRLANRYPNTLVIVLISKDQQVSREKLKEFRNNHDIMEFPMIRDRFNLISEPYGVTNFIPVTILIDPQGKVRHAQYGAFEEGKVFDTLSPLIRETP